MLDVIFSSVLNMSITASFIIAVMLLVRLFLKKAPKIFSYALWAVVLFRLICPFSFESAFALLPINTVPIPQDIVFSAQPQINTGLNVVDNMVNPILPAPNNIENSINPLQVWAFIASAVWAIGIAAMLFYSIIQLVRLKQKLVGATPLRENIYLADHISSPFVMGFIKPRIYLPSSMNEAEQAFIIAHEQHHIKRFDHIARILGFIALSIHWFNPLVWVAFVLSAKDMEMSCDEAVMKKMDTDIRAEYSQSLLRFATGRKLITATPLAFGEGDTKSRIKNVMNFKKPAFWVIAVTVIACIIVAACLLTNPITDKAENSNSKENSISRKDETEQITLTKETADEFIRQTLSTFTLNSDNTISFTLPMQMPTDKSGKTKLYISSSATFSAEPDTKTVQEILDWKYDWQGGETYTAKLDVSQGKLTRAFLRVAFMTQENENDYQEYAADYVEFTEPFIYDTPATVERRTVEIDNSESLTTLKYTMQNGDTFLVTLDLPKGVYLSTTENYPQFPQSSNYEMPTVVVSNEENVIGTLKLSSFGAGKDDLLQTDTAQNVLPMQIFAPIALSNHAEFDDYKVCKSSATGANATAKYLWQDLTDYEGRAPEAPWLSSDSILAYDYEKAPFFIYLNLTDGSLTDTEREAFAKSITITN